MSGAFVPKMSGAGAIRYALRNRTRLTAVPALVNRVKVSAAERTASSGVTAVKHDYSQVISNTPVLNQQSIVLPGPERIHVTSFVQDACYKPYQYYSDASTVYESFIRGMRVSNDGPFLGARTGPNRSYQWISFSQVAEKSRLIGSGFLAQGNKPGSCIGIFAQNRPEWTIADLACAQYSLISVPLYNSLGWEACKYIVNKS